MAMFVAFHWVWLEETMNEVYDYDILFHRILTFTWDAFIGFHYPSGIIIFLVRVDTAVHIYNCSRAGHQQHCSIHEPYTIDSDQTRLFVEPRIISYNRLFCICISLFARIWHHLPNARRRMINQRSTLGMSRVAPGMICVNRINDEKLILIPHHCHSTLYIHLLPYSVNSLPIIDHWLLIIDQCWLLISNYWSVLIYWSLIIDYR